MTDRARAFILRNTRLQRPPYLPELQLYLADEIMPIWHALEELGQQGVPPPFWAFAWAGGQAIARYLLDRPHEAEGRRVLDFGTGSGLCAIAASLGGAASVSAADVDPFCAAAVALNASANETRVGYACRNLLEAGPPAVDVILAGDLWYEEPPARRILTWLRGAHERGTRVLMGDPGRAHFPRDRLTLLAEYDLPVTRELEDRDIKRAGVYTFPSSTASTMQLSPHV